MTETGTPHAIVPRNALVTGGARRIGRANCSALARDGWTVGIHCNRSTDEAETLRREIEAAGGPAYVVPADLARDDAAAGIFAAAARSSPPIPAKNWFR